LNGHKFRRQHPIDDYIVDFVCLAQRLVIKLDGGQHADECVRTYDVERTYRLNAEGFRVIRFWNHDVLGRTEAVLQMIAAALGSPHPNPLPAERGEGAGGG
jgi:very-short-patch-repair endonuclease